MLSQPIRRVRPVLLATRRAQPTVVFIARLTITATAAYLIALALPITERPLLAPVAALLVLQYTLYRTIRSALRRVLAVVAGVLIAVLIAGAVGFTWWTLGIAIGVSLVIGHAVRLGDHILEVPISAILILALGSYSTAGALARVVETLVGAGTGLAASLIASPVRVRPAQDAIAELGSRMGALMDRLADALTRETESETFVHLLHDARELSGDVERTDMALSEAEESMRLNIRAVPLHPMGMALRSGLETLEHTALNVRGMARSLADRERLPPEGGAYDAKARIGLARALREAAEVVRAFALLVRAESGEEIHTCAERLRKRLAEGRRRRDEFADALPPWTSARSAEGRLHAEMLVHLDRLFDLFDVESRAQAASRRRRRRRREVIRPPQRLRRSARRRRRSHPRE